MGFKRGWSAHFSLSFHHLVSRILVISGAKLATKIFRTNEPMSRGSDRWPWETCQHQSKWNCNSRIDVYASNRMFSLHNWIWTQGHPWRRIDGITWLSRSAHAQIRFYRSPVRAWYEAQIRLHAGGGLWWFSLTQYMVIPSVHLA